MKAHQVLCSGGNPSVIRFTKYGSPIVRWLILLSLLISSCVAGQAQSNPGFILQGQVVDQAGAAVKAASVTLVDDKQNEVGVENTDQEGRFAFDGVAVGRYSIAVEAKGFTSYGGDVTVKAAKPDQLKIVLSVEAVKEEVEVKGERKGLGIEANANANAIVLRENAIRRLPRDQEQLRQALERIAGSFAGALNISVNGISGSGLPPTATIKEIRINNDPFSAAYHEPGSARVEIETKSGEGKTQGSVYLGYRNSALDARNAFTIIKPSLEHRDAGGYVGTKLGKRASIFGLVERRSRDETTPVTAYLPDGPFNFNVPTPSKSILLNLRADFQPSDKQTISLFFNHDKGRQRGPEITSFDLPERSSDTRTSVQSVQVSWRVIISPSLINELQIRASRERATSETNNPAAAIEVAAAFNAGGPQCCPERHVGERLSFVDNLTFSSGRHLVKTGVSIAGARTSGMSQRNFGGTHYFASLDQFRLGQPELFTINAGDPNLSFRLWNFAGYVQDEIRLRPGFSISPGLRYETQTDPTDRNNFAPRLGFALSPFKSQITVIRGGAGIFYQQLEEGQLAQALRYNGVRQRQVIINHPVFPDPFAGQPITSFPSSVSRLADNLGAPYQLHSAIGLERRLPADLILTVTYKYIRGVRLFRSRDINAPLPGSLARPRPELMRVTQLESSSSSTSHGLALGFSGSIGQRVSLFGNYTLARAIDDADGPEALPADNYNLAAERGFAARDQRHQVFLGAFLILPYGVQASPYFYFNTGRPYNITTGFDDNNDSIVNDRPPGVRRNSMRGPNFTSLDMRLSKTFGFGNRGADPRPFAIEIAADATNLFNRVNLANFNGVQTSPFFGQANAALNSRQISLQIIFYFN
jgi:hypothetical protein